MRLRGVAIFSLILLAATVWLLVNGDFTSTIPDEEGDAPATTMAPAPRPTRSSDESWLILTEMPEGASAADVGAEIYRLVCRDCHGDRGQGLTDEFRATWAPQDQNCWQSKCHAANHPIEGFDLPRYVPAIIGPNTSTYSRSAADLHDFIQARMPWHDPGSLTNEEYWQLTAFLRRESGLLPAADQLD